MLDKESKERRATCPPCKTALMLYSDPLAARKYSPQKRISLSNDLVNDERPVSLYLVVPPSDKIRLRRLILFDVHDGC